METPLERARLAAGLTQMQAAERLKLSQGHYSRIERDGTASRATVARIVQCFPGLSEGEVLFPKDGAGQSR